jgi:alkylhydroperoxidase family enzyme
MQQGMDDELYNSVHRYYEVDRFTEREKLAIEFGERFAIDHTTIDDEFWSRLRQHFSDQELLELTVVAGFCVGIGRAFQVLDIAVDFDVLWSREPAPDADA